MGNIQLKLNSAGVKEMLKSAGIQQECMRIAQEKAGACGTGYEAQSRTYPERAGAAVVASTSEARRDNTKNNTLLKVVGV